MTKTYKIAEQIIEIRSVYDKVHRYCADYEWEGEPDIIVETCEADIERERNPDMDSSSAYLEELAVYRKIAVEMLRFDTFLMHGSVVAVDNAAYMFTAPSGTGKSTHARLWREMLGARAVMVNDDKPLLKVADGVVTAYGTPWNGKHRLGANIGVPLSAIAVLHRDSKNRIASVNRSAIYPILLQQTYRPASPDALGQTLHLLDQTAAAVRLYELYCNMEPSAAAVSYHGMSGQSF